LKNIFEWLTQNHAWQKIGYLTVLGIALYLILPQITALENSWQVLKSMGLWEATEEQATARLRQGSHQLKEGAVQKVGQPLSCLKKM